jgi:hypothetical protein
MNGVILGIASASVDAEALISSGVGSSQDTDPGRGLIIGFPSQKNNNRTECTMVDTEDTLNDDLLASGVALCLRVIS